MCGITSYVGLRPATELLLAGLQQLEYRGYDSAGIALLSDSGSTDVGRTVGNLDALRAAIARRVLEPVGAGLPEREAEPTTGIGHTRWATHGGVTVANAHPHADTSRRIHIVLNGIIENHSELRRRLAAEGAVIRSQTDAELVVHVISQHDRGDLAEAVRRAVPYLTGHYAFVALSADHPGLLVGARRHCPLVVGVADDGHFVASAIPAFLGHTRRMHEVADDELVVVTAGEVHFEDAATGSERSATTVTVDWDHALAEKGGYDAFMLKEIDEQATAVSDLTRLRRGSLRQAQASTATSSGSNRIGTASLGCASSPAARRTTPGSWGAT